jgi:chromosomal replication initiator protein
MEDFHEKYRDIDVFLVDDIQIMGGANKTQMEFFKLFDILYQGNKQIVITSDKPASELKNIMTRLTSRFEVGLSVDIQIPDLEHRIEILRRKLSSETSQAGDVDFEVLNFIASSFVTNIRELEGAIKRVLFFALTNNTEITVETTQEALEPLLKTRRKSNLLNENNYDRIQSTVSDFYGISIEDLIGKKRHSKYVVPRHISMFLIKSQYNIPYKVIGSLFGDRDHSTVLAACEKIENELRQDKSLKLAVDTITKKLNMN